MRMWLKGFAGMLPSIIYALIPVLAAYGISKYTSLEAYVLYAIYLILGILGARQYKIQTNLGFLGFRIALLYDYVPEPRSIAAYYILGAVLRLIYYYRGYALARLTSSGTYIVTFSAPIIASLLAKYVNKRIAIGIAAAYAIILASYMVRRVIGIITDRLLMPYGASIGVIFAAYVNAIFSIKVFRIVSIFLFGLIPMAVSLGLEAKMLLAMRDLEK